MRDSALLTRSSKDRVRRRDCHSVTGPALCSEVLANFFAGISLCELQLGGRVRVHVGYMWLAVVQQKSQPRENWIHLQNLTPARNLVSLVHKGTEAIIFLGDYRKTNSSHKPSVDFDFFLSFFNRLLVTEWRRLSHLFTRPIIHCAYVTYRCSMLDVCRVNQVPPTILHWLSGRTSGLVTRAQLFEGRLALKPGCIFLLFKSIFSDNFLCYF